MGDKPWKRAERHVAKSLSRWWTSGADEKAMRRIARSGAFPTKGSDGDIAMTKPSVEDFPWTVEVKYRKSWSPSDFHSPELPPTRPICKWWMTLRSICVDSTGKDPLLVVSQAHEHYWCLIDVEWGHRLVETYNSALMPLIWTRLQEPVMVFRLDVLEATDPAEVKALLQEV